MATFGLIGESLKHSFSANYFTEKFNNLALPHRYLNFELKTIEELSLVLTDYPDLKGFNVTIPYKMAIMRFLDEIDDIARIIGAVNTVKVVKENNAVFLKGFNTDVFGFKTSFLEQLETHHRRALVLGNGGASKAVIYVLKELGIDYAVVSRTPDYSQNQLSYQDLKEQRMKDFQIIINTTPVGQFPNVKDSPEIPYRFINKNYYLYDLIYNPAETVFLKQGMAKGAKVMNGYQMLVYQAEKSYEIYA